MKKHLAFPLSIILLCSCSATTESNSKFIQEYADLPIAQSAEERAPLSNFNMLSARYPMDAARKGANGCATVEYVVSENYKVSNIRVLQSSSKSFAKSAEQAVENLKPKSNNLKSLAQPIKAQTRYEYCIEETEGMCSLENINKRTTCEGDDVVLSVASFIKKAVVS